MVCRFCRVVVALRLRSFLSVYCGIGFSEGLQFDLVFIDQVSWNLGCGETSFAGEVCELEGVSCDAVRSSVMA